MDAIILVGGQGTRLRPLTDTRPKPMVDLVDRPFVEHQVDRLRDAGISRIVFSCGYRPDAIEEHFADGSTRGLEIRYVVDPEPLGTGGAIANAESELAGERVVVLNGDILTDLDFGEMERAHVSAGGLASIALTPIDDPSAFGLVRLREDRSVEEFVEKPAADELRPGEPFLINAGTYIFERKALAMIPAGQKVSVERETFPAIAETRRLFGHPDNCYWRDIGTPASYLQASMDVLAGAVRSDSPRPGPYLAAGVAVDPGAIVGSGSSLAADCTIADGASVTDSVVGRGTTIGAGARLEGAIIGADVVVGENAVIGPDGVVGAGATVGADAVVRATTVATGGTVVPGSTPA